MAKALKRPAESWIYILTSDRALEEREQSRFLLSPMTFAERAAIKDDMIRSSVERVYRSAGDIVLAHIVSIDNFPAGEPQPWPKKHEDRERYRELLDDDQVLELGNEIFIRSSLGYRVEETDAPKDGDILKNSPTPEATSTSGASPTTTPSSTPALSASAIPS
jgi:hypothetical protein